MCLLVLPGMQFQCNYLLPKEVVVRARPFKPE